MNHHGENGKKRKLRNYTKEQKEEAVEDALEIGNTASARMHGIPLTTLSDWVEAAKKTFATNDQEKEKHSVPAFEFEPPKSKERKAARRYTPSQKAQMLEYSSDHGIAAAHRKYDVSRYVVGHGVDDAERADLVIKTFEEAAGRHGKPEMVLHDKGSAFWSWRGIGRFTSFLTELGIDQIAAEHKEWKNSEKPMKPSVLDKTL